MVTIEKVSCFPNEGTPQVVAGSPQQGDLVRITNTNGTVIYERYTPPAAPPSPQPKILRSDEVLGLLPAAVVKSIRDSTVAAVVKRYECFKIKPSWTKTEGTALFNDVEAAGLMTTQQNSDALAAWPSA